MTLFAVEALIQKTFHTKNTHYILFCYEFIMQVLPWYGAFDTYYAELVMTWYEALDQFDTTGRDLHESAFRSAIKTRDKRLTDHPAVMPILILGTISAGRVLCDGTDRPQRARPFACERWPDIYQRTR
jgi:hypothetical protein